MRQIESDTLICPHCSHNKLDSNREIHLKERTVLAGKYYLGSVICAEADSVKYTALDLQTKKAVEIIEFYPEKIVSRNAVSGNVIVNAGEDAFYNDCLRNFTKLWKTIESLKGNPSLPNVYDVFIYNSTAYAVTKKINTIPLKNYLADKAKLLSWNNCLSAFKDIITALERLHSCGILHCAVSSSSILVGSDGKLHLSDFSVLQTKSEASLLHKPAQAGFAPIELFDRRFPLGTYTDVYSLAAVMYFSLTGIEPQSSIERLCEDAMMIPFEIANSLDTKNIDALYSALRVYPKDRIQTIASFSAAITNQLSYNQPEKYEDYGEVYEDKNEEVPTENRTVKRSSKGALAVKAVLAAALIFSMLFVTLYSTVLYKNFRIDFLNEALSAFSFLPVNSESSEKPPEKESKPKVDESVTVADFMSLTYGDILNNRTFNKNFKLKYEFEASDTISKNSIISQSIEKGSKVSVGTEITLVVSTGKAIAVLKDVIGMQFNDAYKILTADGFIVEKELLENDGAQSTGEVFTMSLVAGLDFEKGTKVILSVWDEPKTTEPPEQDSTDLPFGLKSLF